MPLVRCPDCNKEVSNLAPACIHCGRPLDIPPPAPPPPPPPKKRFPAHAVLGAVGALAIAAGIGCLLWGAPLAAAVALGAGLACVLAGGIWSWCARG